MCDENNIFTEQQRHQLILCLETDSREKSARAIHPKSNRKDTDVQQLSQFNYVPVNAHSSQGEPQLYTFEDNEAVIQDDNQRKMSDNETCAKNPQICS